MAWYMNIYVLDGTLQSMRKKVLDNSGGVDKGMELELVPVRSQHLSGIKRE